MRYGVTLFHVEQCVTVSTYRRIDVSTYRRIDVSPCRPDGNDDKYYTPIRRPGDESNRRGKQAAGGRRADRTHRRIAKKKKI